MGLRIFDILLTPDNPSWIQHENALEYFGRDSQFTTEVFATHNAMQQFWNMTDVEYVLWGLHSEVLMDRDVLERAIVGNFELLAILEEDPTIAEYDNRLIRETADAIETYIATMEGAYTNPALSFGAAATSIKYMLEEGVELVVPLQVPLRHRQSSKIAMKSMKPALLTDSSLPTKSWKALLGP